MSAEIKDWKIEVITTYHKDTFKDSGLKTVADLRKYFTQFQGRGKRWGYVVDKRRPPHWQDDLTTKVVVCLEWTDQTGSTRKEFTDLIEFVYFLHEYPEIAKCLGYKPKIK
jgi:hypothetical protein